MYLFEGVLNGTCSERLYCTINLIFLKEIIFHFFLSTTILCLFSKEPFLTPIFARVATPP